MTEPAPATAALTPDDLAGQAGAPFTTAETEQALAVLRALAGWHIAPVQSDTVVLDHDGGPVAHLPTLRLVSVDRVEDLTDPARPVTLSGVRASHAGMIHRAAGLPTGFGALRVTFTHGYEALPAELLPIAAAGARRRVLRESLAGRSVEWDASETVRNDQLTARYRLGAQP